MRLNEGIAPHLHDIRNRMKASIRTEPDNQNVSGWGQFLDAEGHKEQIGPYGTCAAILLNRILQPRIVEDDNVIAQIERSGMFRTKTPSSKIKMFELAFLS